MSVIEALDEEECYLWSILSDSSGIDHAEFLWAEDAGPDGLFRAWDYQWSWWRCTDKLILNSCIAAGHLVQTSTGMKPIEVVEIGDKVLTHKGRWRTVLNVLDQGVRDVVCVKGQGHPGLIVTSDHKLYARDVIRASKPKDGHKGKKYSAPLWRSPEEWIWNNDSQIMTSAWSSGQTQYSPLDVDHPVKITNKSSLIADSALDVDLLWLYGVYLGDGFTYVSDQNNRTAWSVHEDQLEELLLPLKRLGFENPNIRKVKNERAYSVYVDNISLTDWIRRNGGVLCANKELAPWVLGLNPEQREAVFEGLIFSDGWRSADGYRIGFTNTCKKLAIGFRMLASSLGYSSSMWRRDPINGEIDGRKIIGKRVSWQVECHALEGQRKSRCVEIDNHQWTPLSSVIPAGQAKVYDLTVEEDHSFVVEGITVSNCGRSVGKSASAKLKAFAFPFIHPGQELVITAPEGVHLDALTDNVETSFEHSRLGKEMLQPGRTGIKHRPFHMNFANGCRIMGRIPQHDGKGVKGIHPHTLILDEGQDYPDAGWLELIETVKAGEPDSQWIVHGVTRGVRDYFYKFSQPGTDWTVFRKVAMNRPNWTDEERQSKIEMYGSKDNPDYRRNVLGLPGDATNPIFVLARLMASVCQDLSDPYNVSEYSTLKINAEQVVDYGGDILPLMDLPHSHKQYETVWIGADIGFTQDPTEILVFAEEHTTPKSPSRLKLISRVRLHRVDHTNQAKAILWLIDFYKPKCFAMDRTGLGLPLFQAIQDMAKNDSALRPYLDRIKGYNFSEKIIVELDDSVEIDEYMGKPEDAGIKRNVLEASTDILRTLVDSKRLCLPWDKEIIGEFQGQTYTFDKSTMDMYGRARRFSKGSFHTLDAARMAVLGWSQHALEQLLSHESLDLPSPVFMREHDMSGSGDSGILIF